MIRVSVMYPNTPGARFNHEYYRDKHMPLLKKRMGDSCLYYSVDKGLAGGVPERLLPTLECVTFSAIQSSRFRLALDRMLKRSWATFPTTRT